MGEDQTIVFSDDSWVSFESCRSGVKRILLEVKHGEMDEMAHNKSLLYLKSRRTCVPSWLDGYDKFSQHQAQQSQGWDVAVQRGNALLADVV